MSDLFVVGGTLKGRYRFIGLAVLAVACVTNMFGCSNEECFVPQNLAGVIYEPTTQFVGVGSSTTKEIDYIGPKSLLKDDDPFVNCYVNYGMKVRGPDEVWDDVLGSHGKLKFVKICGRSNSSFEGLVAYVKILTGPHQGATVEIEHCITIGNTGVSVRDFTSKYNELEKRKKAGEPLDFSYYTVDKRYLKRVN